MTSLIKKLIKINIISILFSILCLSYVQATIFNEIKIIGNDRLSVETIKMFSGLDIGVNIEDEDLNIAIKKLYKTDYFKDIKIFKNNDILEISIIENPIIQSIKIDGIKNKSILKSIS